MYNRYIPGSGGYTRVTVPEPGDRPQPAPPPSPPPPPPPAAPPPPPEPSARRPAQPSPSRSGFPPIPGGQGLLDGLAAPLRLLTGEDKNAGIAGVLKALNLEDLDSGDVLLLLIMLFLFLEGDNLELVITLGLMLLFSLGEEKGKGAEGKGTPDVENGAGGGENGTDNQVS